MVFRNKATTPGGIVQPASAPGKAGTWLAGSKLSTTASRGTYGSPRLHQMLRREGSGMTVYGPRKDLALTMGAFNRAVESRKPAADHISHADRGNEYRALAFRDRLSELGFDQSMNRPARKMDDNASMESFFHSMKAHWATFKNGRSAAGFGRWYKPFYNRRRLHSSLGYRSPEEFEVGN